MAVGDPSDLVCSKITGFDFFTVGIAISSLLLFTSVSTNTVVRDKAQTDEYRWNTLQLALQRQNAASAITRFLEKGIDPILIKGVAVAEYYPQTISRNSIDIDLAIRADQLAIARSLVASGTFEGIAIDLHCELRHLDCVPWDELYKNSRFLNVNGNNIRVLRPEDHLRVVCIHWLTDGGRDKERLWDIFYMVANRPADFDWEQFVGPIPDHRKRWLGCAIGLAHQYLGLKIDDIPIDESLFELPRWLVKTIEREWSANVKLMPLEVSYREPRLFVQQMLKRSRPNPIWSTVIVNGRFDAPTRIHYQVASLFVRLFSFFKRHYERHRAKV